MKVLQLGKFYPIRGGVEKVMWDLTSGLSARGIDCDMLCAELEKDEIIHLNEHGRVICRKAWKKIAATMIAPKMVSWLRKHKDEYDIIHVHHPDPMACLALWLSGYKGRVILHWHSDILKQKTLLKFYAPLQRWLIRRADTIIGTTPVYLKESPYLQDAQDKTVAVPIGIKPVTFDEELVRQWKQRYAGKKLVVSIGRLVPYKGYGYLIAAAEKLGADYQVLIVGDGPVHDQLEEYITSAGIQDHVKLLGYLEDNEMYSLLAACDVFVLSSVMKTEAFGIVQIEAMSLGKPVIATKIPESGVSWVNADGLSGLNVPIKDAEALAGAVRTVCSDQELHDKLSAGAARRFRDTFTIDQMIDRTIKIYNDENPYQDEDLYLYYKKESAIADFQKVAIEFFEDYIGEDIPMSFYIFVEAGRGVIRLLSPQPIKVEEGNYAMMAQAVNAINENLVNGCFTLDTTNGMIVWRVTIPYMESLLSEQVYDYLILISLRTVDDYNDKLLMLNKGLLDLDAFVQGLRQ